MYAHYTAASGSEETLWWVYLTYCTPLHQRGWQDSEGCGVQTQQPSSEHIPRGTRTCRWSLSAPLFLSPSPTPLLLSPSISSPLLSLSPCPSHSCAVAVLFSLYPLPLLPFLYPPYSLHFPSILLGQLSIWVSKEVKSTCHLLWIFITVV